MIHMPYQFHLSTSMWKAGLQPWNLSGGYKSKKCAMESPGHTHAQWQWNCWTWVQMAFLCVQSRYICIPNVFHVGACRRQGFNFHCSRGRCGAILPLWKVALYQKTIFMTLDECAQFGEFWNLSVRTKWEKALGDTLFALFSAWALIKSEKNKVQLLSAIKIIKIWITKE